MNAIHFAIDLLKGDACKFYLLNVQKASSFISDDMMAVNSSATIYKTIINAAKKSIDNIILILKQTIPMKILSFIPLLIMIISLML